MKTKIKKRIVSVVAFMSLVVSLVGILPLGAYAGELKNNTSGTLKFETSGGTGDSAYTQTFSVSSGGVYCMYDKSSGRPYLISASDFSVTVDTVDSKGKLTSHDYRATKEKCDHYTVYSYNLYDLSGKKISGYAYDRDSAYNYLAGAGKPSDDSLDFDGYVVANGTSYLTETKILYDMNHDNGGYSSGALKPYFYLASSQAKRNSVLSSYWNCKWGLTWKLPDNVDHSGYYLDVCVSNNATKADMVSICDASKQTIPVSKKYYSFWTNPQVRDAMMSCWSDWRPNKKNVFYVYARVKNKSGVASDWTIFQCYPNGTIGTVYGRSDANWDKTEEFKGETGSYSDGTKTDANGSYYVPDSGYDPSGETDDSGYKKDYSWKDDVSGVDNGTIDKSSFMGLLNDCINSIGNVPAILSQLVPWIPDDIIALIGVAFGFIVVVGVIKWVL